jgi:ElaB/YqjD/DUF883 family membrane-anchored ribosome-binding protein
MSATLATAIAGNGVGRAQQAVGTQFEELFDGVDDLIKRVADVENPEIRRTRARVHAAMVAARRVAAMGVAARPQEVQVADRTDGYLRDYPGQALGVALLLGIGVGLIVYGRQ